MLRRMTSRSRAFAKRRWRGEGAIELRCGGGATTAPRSRVVRAPTPWLSGTRGKVVVVIFGDRSLRLDRCWFSGKVVK